MSQILLKVKAKTGQIVVKELKSTSTVHDLKEHLSKLTSIPIYKIVLLAGYPPKIIDSSNHKKSLAEISIKSGDTLIIEESLKEELVVDEKPVLPSAILSNSDYDLTPIMRQIVPADNSCLFTSIGFILSGKVDTALSSSSYMRELIAKEVSNDPDKYSEAILGKTNSEYCDWIRKLETWGGAIELAVLSHYYGLELAVADTMNSVINRFGEDRNYCFRGFLIFDGVHYDPLYREPSEPGGSPVTLFKTSDEESLKQVQELADEAKSSKQYTDIERFTLRCLVCRTELKGQAQAQQHAKSTGHQSFGEIAS